MAKRTTNRSNIRSLTENGFTVTVETKGILSEQVFDMCRSIDDVQRCAGMGDFRIVGYDLPAAGA